MAQAQRGAPALRSQQQQRPPVVQSRPQGNGRRPVPPNAASWAAPAGTSAGLRELLAADADLALRQRAVMAVRQQEVEQLLAESAALEASMDAKAQEWGRSWAALQGEVDALRDPAPTSAAPGSASNEEGSWVGPLFSAWAFLAASLQQRAGQQTFADWLDASWPVGTLRLLSSAWAHLTSSAHAAPPPQR